MKSEIQQISVLKISNSTSVNIPQGQSHQVTHQERSRMNG